MMSTMTKREYLIELKTKYRKASKKQKGQLLDDFCDFTGHNRKYAMELLSKPLKSQWKHRKTRPKVYNQAVSDALLRLWDAADFACGERLHPYIPELLEALENCREILISDETKEKLLRISLSTAKRILAKKKHQTHVKIKGTTKPGTLLKHQIAIRFGPWEEVDPGWCETDTVAHCGDTVSGEFIYSLNLTDISSGWSEQGAIWGKGERATVAQMDKLRARLPFVLLGLDPDNGSEFINWHMHRYCKKNNITLTRSRPYKKNDNAHIEQKNWTAVRQLVGYDRLGKKTQLKLLNDLYTDSWRFYVNFFQPVMKLKEKSKDLVTGKIKKKYYEAKTPYRRLMEHPKVPKEAKAMLQSIYRGLNPFHLKAEIKAKLIELRNTLKSDN